MSEEFKNTLDSFIKEIIIKIQDKSTLGEIQNKYNDLTEQYYNLTILSKEEFESIDSSCFISSNLFSLLSFNLFSSFSSNLMSLLSSNLMSLLSSFLISLLSPN